MVGLVCSGGSRAGLRGSLNCLSHVKKFLILLVAIGKTVIWRAMPPGPLDQPLLVWWGFLLECYVTERGYPLESDKPLLRGWVGQNNNLFW